LCTVCKFVSDWHGHDRGWEGSRASRSRGFGSPGLCSEIGFPLEDGHIDVRNM